MKPYAQEMAQQVPVTRVCQTLALSRSSYYRSQPPPADRQQEAAPQEKPARKPHPRALTQAEETTVRTLLNSPRFQDLSPYEVYGTLLDEDARYLCSVRTMYRILEKYGETTPRGRQRPRTTAQKPELLATAPNQVWSWDITKLKGPQKWTYYYLYVMLDIFSRYVVGWLIAPAESAALAKEFLATCCLQQGIAPDELTIHADRGSAMTSKAVAQLFGGFRRDEDPYPPVHEQ